MFQSRKRGATKQQNARKKLSLDDVEDKAGAGDASMSAGSDAIRSNVNIKVSSGGNKRSTTSSSKIRNDKKKKKSGSNGSQSSSSLLSFDEGESGEDGHVFKKKKKVKSRKHKRPLPDEVNRSEESRLPTFQSESVGRYTPEELAKLQKNAVTFASKGGDVAAASSKNTSRSPTDMLPPAPRAGGTASIAIDVAALLGNNGTTEKGRRMTDVSAIPSKDAIARTLAKRDRMRRIASGEVIPLRSEACSDNDGSALVRENDDDVEMAEFNEKASSRVRFGDPGADASVLREMREVHSRADDDDSDNVASDEDLELQDWEREQIMRGAGRMAAEAVDMSGRRNRSGGGDKTRREVTSRELVDVAVPTMSVDDYICDLEAAEKQLNEMLIVQAGTITRLEGVEAAAIEEEKAMEEDFNICSNQYEYFQQLQAYLNDLLGCLSAKTKLIDDLARRMDDATNGRQEALVRLRLHNLVDEVEEAEARFGAVAKGERTKQIDLDEFGRDKNEHSKADKARRKVDRVKRRGQKRAQRTKNSEPEGWSSDEEDGEIVSDCRSNREAILNEKLRLFDDTLPEYSKLEVVVRKFEVWKRNYPMSYQNAYVSISLASVFEPFVKLELLNWEPIDGPTFVEHEWYKRLLTFGFGDDNVDEKDEDLNLIPKLIKRLVVPKIVAWVERSFDCSSSHFNDVADALITELKKYFEEEPDVITGVFRALYNRFKAAVKRTQVPFYPDLPETKEPYLLSQRLFWSGVKLLRNVVMWHAYFSERSYNTTAKVLLDGKLLPFLYKIDHAESVLKICEKIVSSCKLAEVLDASRQRFEDGGGGGGAAVGPPLLPKYLHGFRAFLVDHIQPRVETCDTVVQNTRSEPARQLITRYVALLTLFRANDDLIVRLRGKYLG